MPHVDERDYMNAPARYPSLTVFNVNRDAAAVTTAYENAVLNTNSVGCLRLAVMSGDYPWHAHPGSDELFLVLSGRLTIELADGRSFILEPWDALTVPASVVHRTRAEGRTVNLCFEESAAETVFVERG